MQLTIFLKALPELFSAALLFALWADPLRFGLDWFRSGVLTLLLEFFVIHASGFMAVLIVTPEVRDAAGFNANGGDWEAEPYRALAGAVLYFAIMGLSRPLFALAQKK